MALAEKRRFNFFDQYKFELKMRFALENERPMFTKPAPHAIEPQLGRQTADTGCLFYRFCRAGYLGGVNIDSLLVQSLSFELGGVLHWFNAVADKPACCWCTSVANGFELLLKLRALGSTCR